MAYITPTCTGISGIADISCVVLNSTSLVLTYNAVPLNSVQISIDSIRNYDVGSVGVNFSCSFYNSLNYAMENSPIYQQIYNSDTITAVTINNDDQLALY